MNFNSKIIKVHVEHNHWKRGTVHNNKARCSGYANTYARLMRMLGIECYYVLCQVAQGEHACIESLSMAYHTILILHLTMV